jgi:hypothetical protein
MSQAVDGIVGLLALKVALRAAATHDGHGSHRSVWVTHDGIELGHRLDQQVKGSSEVAITGWCPTLVISKN